MTQGTGSSEAFYPEKTSKSEFAQLLGVMETCDTGLCILDADMRLLAWNPHFPKIVRKEIETELVCQVNDILPQLASPQFVNLVRSVVQQRVSEDKQTFVHTPGLSASLLFFKSDDNLFKQVSVHPIATHPDYCLLQISEVDPEMALQKQARSASLSEQRSLAMLSSIEDAVILADADGSIEFANQAAMEMTGYQNSEISGKQLTEIYRVFDDSGNVRQQLNYEQIAGHDNSRPLQLMHRNEHSFSIEQSLTHLKNERGEIEGVVLVFKDLSRSGKLTAQLNWHASHDPITQLYNRTEFINRLSQRLDELVEVEGATHCLLYLDLDRFKVINDICGHMAGDELLRQVASLIKLAIRSSDLIARISGDEFAILLDSCSLDAAKHIADALRLQFQQFRYTWDDKTFSLSVSIGLVCMDAESEGAQHMLSYADAACCAAKEAGRNQINVYYPDKSVAAQRHGEALWVTRIRNALEEDRFILYVQPIHGLAAGSEVQQYYEVLVRMIDESGNLILPGEFMPAAERYDLMPAIDRWVVAHLVERITQGNCCAGKGQRLFVNLSGHSLCDKETLQMVVDTIRQNKLREGLLCFELTETAAITNLSSAKRFMHIVKRFGCKFALDDFGSGFSSFGYLKHLPVEYLKIDGGFVKDMASNRIDESMVEAINHIGHIMGLKTIAECVENDEILHRLTAMGVDYAQGFGIRRPFAIDELIAESTA